MLLEPIFTRFVQRSPFAVMSRALLERALCPRDLDALFERQADKQYTREPAIPGELTKKLLLRTKVGIEG